MKCGGNTVMKGRTLSRHFREGFRNIGRNGWMTFASVSAVTVTLLLVGVFLVVMLNLNHFAKSVENDVEINAYIERTATADNIKDLEKQLNNVPKVGTVEFSSKEEELRKLIDGLGEEGKVFEPFKQQNPLNAAYIIKPNSPKDVESVAKKVEKLDYIEKVEYGQEYVDKLFDVVSVARNIGIVLIVGLVFTAMFLISNTIKITIIARRSEIEIMRLVGATNSFIRWPFFLEGLFLGVLGSIIPIAIVVSTYALLFDSVQPDLAKTYKTFELLPVFPFTLQLSLLLVLIGACIGVWGSMISMRKFLKK